MNKIPKTWLQVGEFEWENTKKISRVRVIVDHEKKWYYLDWTNKPLETDTGYTGTSGLERAISNIAQAKTGYKHKNEVLHEANHESDECGICGESIKANQRIINFYKVRIQALQEYQNELPEPHRTLICNILANGSKW